MRERIIFVNIGWMKRYAGPSPTDPLIADNFAYFKHYQNREAVGHEQWNFLGTGGSVYGYVPRSSGINISRLGAKPNEKTIDGVLVVFVARDPAAHKLKVVGWYKNATVARSPIFSRTFGRTKVEAPITASESDAHVLAVANRSIIVPTAQREAGGVGQAPVWYAEKHPEVIRHVRELVENDAARRHTNPRQGKPARNNNTESRLATEKFAMDWALRYFDEAVDVSRHRKGWDVEAVAEFDEIYIEVKGLSGGAVSFELTPNEYGKMLQHKDRYLLFVVTEALTRRARARTFRYSAREQEGVWVSEDGEELIVNERTGAWASYP